MQNWEKANPYTLAGILHLNFNLNYYHEQADFPYPKPMKRVNISTEGCMHVLSESRKIKA
jgi:hypothetical protein